jgi:Cu+-exporting ATPase
LNKIYHIEGMTCASCSQIIEENARKFLGIETFVVNFATEKANLEFNDQFQEDKFFSMLEKLGYRAIDPVLKENADDKDNSIFQDATLRASIISLFFGGICMNLSMGSWSQLLSPNLNSWIQGILSLFVMLMWGRHYLLSLIHFIKSGQSNMNTLIGIGVSASFIYSFFLMLSSGHNGHVHVYFETIPFIIGFTLFGHFLDEKAKTKARGGLSALYKLQIKFALKVLAGSEVSVPVIELKKGDSIRLKPGEKVPLDGEILQGNTHTDESMITGESQAVAKGVGDNLFAGSLNLEGSVLLKITHEMHETFISGIVDFVEKAQLKKAPIEKYANRVIRYFVPFIIIFSSLTFLFWWFYNPGANQSALAFSHMTAVLLIACPCALGLAVPMAVMLATVEATRHGLLISGGDVIEKSCAIDTVVFDKTGTLTEGHPVVTSFQTNLTNEEFLKFSGSVVQYSNHPLSKAIASFVNDKKIKLVDPDTFNDLPGKGMMSTLLGKKILIGKKELLESENISVVVPALGSHVYVGIDQVFAGVFVIEDPLKITAKETVQKLILSKKEVWMITGDNQSVAKKTADALGILNFKANVLPAEKAEFINALKKSGKKVAMVGDGINDAPALSSADIGLAMAGGSDVAIEAADVSLLDGKIEGVPIFFELSKNTMRIIKQNLFLSFFYNLLCIPLAAGVFTYWISLTLTPMWASLAMGLSSVSVVLSSLRLKKHL